jgi:hypothetical protein
MNPIPPRRPARGTPAADHAASRTDSLLGAAADRMLAARLSGHQVTINGNALCPPLYFVAAIAVGTEPRFR